MKYHHFSLKKVRVGWSGNYQEEHDLMMTYFVDINIIELIKYCSCIKEWEKWRQQLLSGKYLNTADL